MKPAGEADLDARSTIAEGPQMTAPTDSIKSKCKVKTWAIDELLGAEEPAVAD